MKKIKIVLLAAGSGKRFGGGKLEALVDGKPMYLHALEKISDQILPDHPVVVTGNPVIIAAAEEKYIKNHPKFESGTGNIPFNPPCSKEFCG